MEITEKEDVEGKHTCQQIEKIQKKCPSTLDIKPLGYFKGKYFTGKELHCLITRGKKVLKCPPNMKEC